MTGTDLVAPGRVAVVTGAASGIGFGLCERFVAEGMRVLLADVEVPALTDAAATLAARGGEVLAVRTDVADPDQVDALRERVLAEFGAVHVVCNNAGVGGPTRPVWEIPREDWEWVLGVNLWGVLNGVRAFVPSLLRQGFGHVVNTASIFGVFAGSLGAYGVSKHGVVALSENLYFDLRDTPVGVSVLCPGAVRTNFGSSDRNRPAGPVERDPGEVAFGERMERLSSAGRAPGEVADIVVAAIRERRFYVLTSTNRNAAVRRRGEEIVAGGPPEPPFP